MNKIAVFGDSFSARMNTEFSPTIDDFIKELFKLNNRPYNKDDEDIMRKNWGEQLISWPELIGADIYGHSGSDLYYSYNQFINNHKNYDKCVFVITTPDRYSTYIDGHWKHAACIDMANEKAKFSQDYNTKKIFNTISNYFKYVLYQDEERVQLIHQAMLDSIVHHRPDTIFINAFNDLVNVYQLELDAWNITHEQADNYNLYVDLRQCHMTDANNKILANHILDNLDSTGVLDLSSVKWKIPNVEDRHYHLPDTKDLFTRLL